VFADPGDGPRLALVMTRELREPQVGPEEARRAAEERWRAAFENPRTGIAIVGPAVSSR
jgi:hypothetical protein